MIRASTSAFSGLLVAASMTSPRTMQFVLEYDQRVPGSNSGSWETATLTIARGDQW
jgi:hypothetical protein